MAIRNKVIYEQSLWNQEHIEAINQSLKGLINSDGQWHPYSHPNGSAAWYRVFEEHYFQAVYAKKSNPTLVALMSLLPVATEDDAEWTIWKRSDGYAMTSIFALTPGPFNHTKDVAEWLNRHALGFVDDKHGLRGVSYFADIERGCLSDAMERLAWLETVILSLNEQIEDLGTSFWAGVKNYSDEICNRIESSVGLEEIIPVPEAYRPQGPKYREPIIDKE